MDTHKEDGQNLTYTMNLQPRNFRGSVENFVKRFNTIETNVFQHRASFGQQLIGDNYYFVAKMDEKEVLHESIQDQKSYAKMKLNGIGGGIGDIRNIIISGNLLNR